MKLVNAISIVLFACLPAAFAQLPGVPLQTVDLYGDGDGVVLETDSDGAAIELLDLDQDGRIDLVRTPDDLVVGEASAMGFGDLDGDPDDEELIVINNTGGGGMDLDMDGDLDIFHVRRPPKE